MALLNHAKCSPESISCSYTRATPNHLPPADDELAVVNFGGRCGDPGQAGVLCTGLVQLQQPAMVESWFSTLATERGVAGQCQWSSNDESLFAALYVDEQQFPSQRQAIQHAYNQLLALSRSRGYPHLIRVWNYMADINRGAGDDERYKQFCLGRLDAFTDNGYQLAQFPSACALGHSGGDTIIYLLAAKQPGTHFENPRQISAYQYPGQYGPASPSFARATLANWSGGRQLYLSGTASIVGHESRHSAAMGKQLRATCDNIDALLQHVAGQIGSKPLHLDTLKVYLRHPEHFDAARTAIKRHFGSEVPALYVQADICRSELLVEVDGICKVD